MFNLREHFKLTGIYTFFAAFPALLQLIVYPIIEGKNRLGAEDFGYLAIAEAIISFLVIFISFGSAVGISRFYYDYNENSDKLKVVISTFINSIIARSLLILGVILLLSPIIGNFFQAVPLQQFSIYGPFLVFSAFNRSIIGFSTVLYRNQKNILFFLIISSLSGLARSSFQIIGVLYFDLSFLGYVYGTAIGGGITALLALIFIFLKYKCRFSFVFSKSLFSFSIPLVLNDVLFWGTQFIDRFFLLKNPNQLGIYDNAIKFALGIQLIIQGLSNAVQPELYRYFKIGKKQTEKEIKSISNLFIAEAIVIIAIAIIPVMLFIDVFYETELKLSASIITIVLMRFILMGQYYIFQWPIIYAKKTNIFFIINFVVFSISVLLNWLLVPLIGYYGAIISLTFANIVQVIIFQIAQRKINAIPWNLTKIFYYPLSIVVFSGIIEIFKIHFSLNIYLCSSFVVCYIIIGLFFIYQKDIITIIRKNFTK